nr:MAG TPA: hypothetical protein [Herelleviridae sp.]
MNLYLLITTLLRCKYNVISWNHNEQNRKFVKIIIKYPEYAKG